MKRTTLVLNTVVAVFLWVGWAAPAAAQNVGAIGGTAVDDSDAVLPGVTITLSNPGTIGGNQTTTTDGAGTYQFANLVPGRYSVKGELQGFRTVIQSGIVVNAARTSRADLKLAVGDVAETVTVTGGVPLLDTASTLNQTVMTRQVLDSLPVATDIWSISRLTPGVYLDKYDVGGREMFASSLPRVHGSLAGEVNYLIDGLDTNSYNSGGTTSFYYDSFMFQEVNYQTGNAAPDTAKGGVTTSMVSKTGTNVYHGAVMFNGSNEGLESNNISSALRSELLSQIAPQVRVANPNIEPGNQLQEMYDASANMGGPIVKDHLWFTGSARLAVVNAFRVGSYNPDGTKVLADNQMRNASAKISWGFGNNQLHYLRLYNLRGRYHGAGTTTTQFFESNATPWQASPQHMNIVRWTSVLSPKAMLEVGGNYYTGQSLTEPQEGVVNGSLPKFDAVLNLNTVAAATYSLQQGMRSNIVSSLTYAAGNHDLKVGYSFIGDRHRPGEYSISEPNGLRAVYRNGVPDSVNTYNTPSSYYRSSDEHAVYVQDKWRITRKLTANFGLRFQTMYGWLAADNGVNVPPPGNPGPKGGELCQTATAFVAGQCFPGVKGVPDFTAMVPRLSAIYDVFGNGRTALKFSANRFKFPSGHGIDIADKLNPIRPANDTRAWSVCAAGQTTGCDLNRDLIPQANELGPSTGYNLGTTNRYAPGFKWPSVNEISSEFEQQLRGPVVVSVGYYYRGYRDMFVSTNEAVPRSSYTPLNVVEAVTGRQVTVFNQAPALRGRFDTVWSNSPAADRSFHGVDATVTKRLQNRWMMMASLSLARTRGDIYDETGLAGLDQNDPNLTFRIGPSAIEVPRSVKFAGAFEFPYGLSLGSNFQYYQGWPETTTVRVAADTVRLTQVSQIITVEPRGAIRLQNVKTLDLNIRKAIRHGSWSLEPRIDIFNLLNAAAKTRQVSQLGPTYGRAIELLGARLIKFGVNLIF